jgi:hypothetical protein
LYQVKPFSQLFDKQRDITKIVTVVRIAHNDEPAACCGDAAHQGIAVSFSLNLDDTGAQADGNSLGLVQAAVVGHNDFPSNLMLAQCALSFLDAGS